MDFAVTSRPGGRMKTAEAAIRQDFASAPGLLVCSEDLSVAAKLQRTFAESRHSTAPAVKTRMSMRPSSTAPHIST